MLSSRPAVSAGLKTLHNGKGRPLNAKISTRLLSSCHASNTRPTIQYDTRSFNRLRPQATTFAPAGARLASNTAETPTSFATPTDAPTPAFPEPNAWDSTFNDFSLDVSTIEPHIGYLKELGISFGYGPTSMMQWLLEHLHVYSGMPWFGTLVVSAVLVRLSLIKLYLNAADQSGRLATLKPAMAPLQAEIAAAKKSGDQQAMMASVARIQQVYKRAGLKSSKIFYPVLIQAPLGFATFRLTRTMSELPVPDLQTGGFLWVTDLTIPDPTYLLPAFFAGTLYLTLKRGGEMGTLDDNQKTVMGFAKYGFPALSMIFGYFQPASTQLIFATTGVLSYIQSRVVTSPGFRAMVGIHPLPEKPAPDAKVGPYKGTITRYAVDPKTKPEGFYAASKAKAKDWLTTDQSNTRLSRQDKWRADAYEKKRREEIEEENWRNGKDR